MSVKSPVLCKPRGLSREFSISCRMAAVEVCDRLVRLQRMRLVAGRSGPRAGSKTPHRVYAVTGEERPEAGVIVARLAGA